jgi:hypothetical protein
MPTNNYINQEAFLEVAINSYGVTLDSVIN